VPPDRAGRVVERLLRDDIFSGWGLRSLSADHPTYDPLSYHVGSVWPHDTAIAVAGFRRYGFHDLADRLAQAVLDAAGAFPLARLPEVFSGLTRTEQSRPVPLPPTSVPQLAIWRSSTDQAADASADLLTVANAPQAWSASAVIWLVAGRSAPR
jgi:glycogen debranching enzyme